MYTTRWSLRKRKDTETLAENIEPLCGGEGMPAPMQH